MLHTGRLRNILKKLPHVACKSDVYHQHGAVIIRNGTPVAWGFNVIKGKKTYHAEHDVIRRYLASQGFVGWKKHQCKLCIRQVQSPY